MRRALTAALLLAAATTLPASPALAADGPHVTVTPPAVVGAGLNPADLPVEVVNTGGDDHWGVRLRLTLTPVAGSDLRPLDSTVQLTYRFGVQWRALNYETVGDSLVATTPDLAGLSADETATYQLQIAARPTSAAPHVDTVTVDVTTEALDSNGTVFATDGEPDRVALVEPRADLSSPASFTVGAPSVIKVALTNTTPLAYSILRPGIALYRAGNDQITVERLDGDEWTPVSGPSSSSYWWYSPSYPSLQPGDTYTETLRVTFNDESAAGETGTLHHIGYTYFGYPIALDSHPYTVEGSPE